MTFYVDLDDTVADFRKKAETLLGRKLSENCRDINDNEWKILNSLNENLFLSLELTHNAKETIQTIQECFPEETIIFLSAIPKKMNKDSCIKAKTQWLEKYFPGFKFIFTDSSKEKANLCQPRDFIIDDKIDICELWLEKDGIAIHYQSHNDIIQTIKYLK